MRENHPYKNYLDKACPTEKPQDAPASIPYRYVRNVVCGLDVGFALWVLIPYRYVRNLGIFSNGKSLIERCFNPL